MSDDSQVPESILTLLRTLIDGTKSGRLTWSEAAPGFFLYTGTQAAAVISSSDADGGPPWEFRVLDKDGQTVDRYEAPTQTTPLDLDRALEALYDEIRRRVRIDTVDPVIKSLIEDASGG
jgi:hypothetical protein